MTVAELIKELQKQPQHLEVRIYVTQEGYDCEPLSVEPDHMTDGKVSAVYINTTVEKDMSY